MAIVPDNIILSEDQVKSAIKGEIHQAQWGFYNDMSGSKPEEKPHIEFLNGTLHELEKGERLPMAKVTNNPNLNPPKVSDQRYFGQSPIYKVAMDQLIAKRIGIYPSSSHGAGGSFFNIANNPNITPSMGLDKFVSTIMTGGITALTSGNLQSGLGVILNNITGIVGGASTQTIQTTDKNVLIPLLSAMSSAVSGGTALKPTFSNDIFKTGYTLYQTVQAHINRGN